MKIFPSICQYFITRRCNGGCAICALRRGHCVEMSPKESETMMLDLAEGGVKGVKTLGGEPTLLPWLPDFVKFVNEKTNMRMAILSNCHFKEEMADRLVAAGLDTFFASYDIPETEDAGMREKAVKATGTLAYFKKRGVKVLGINIVIAPHNLEQIPKIVEEFSRKEIWTNLSPLIHGKGDFVIRTEMIEGIFSKKDRPGLQGLTQKLIHLKNSGALITNSKEYLLGLPTMGIHLNWHCRKLTMLQLDYDGKIMTCPDREGKKSFSPKDLLGDKTKEFEIEWQRDTSKCSGCYWSASYDASFGLPAYWR